MNILVAATDPDLCRVLQTTLTQAGHDVRQAPDARAALAMHSSLPADVLLIDQRLPDRTGMELLRQIRDREGPRRTVPALLLADYPRPPLLEEAKSLQAVRVLAKPPSLLDLLDLLTTLVPARPAAPPSPTA